MTSQYDCFQVSPRVAPEQHPRVALKQLLCLIFNIGSNFHDFNGIFLHNKVEYITIT